MYCCNPVHWFDFDGSVIATDLSHPVSSRSVSAARFIRRQVTRRFCWALADLSGCGLRAILSAETERGDIRNKNTASDLKQTNKKKKHTHTHTHTLTHTYLPTWYAYLKSYLATCRKSGLHSTEREYFLFYMGVSVAPFFNKNRPQGGSGLGCLLVKWRDTLSAYPPPEKKR